MRDCLWELARGGLTCAPFAPRYDPPSRVMAGSGERVAGKCKVVRADGSLWSHVVASGRIAR